MFSQTGRGKLVPAAVMDAMNLKPGGLFPHWKLVIGLIEKYNNWELENDL